MPNKETTKSQSQSTPQNQKLHPKKTDAVDTGEFDISGSEHLGEDSEETDFEITGRESLISKKDDKHKKSKH